MSSTKKSKKQKTPAGTKVTKEFEFKLTEAEFSEKGKSAAALSREVTDLKVQFEEVKDTWNAKIKTRAAKRDDVLAVIHAKKEKRTVDAVLVKNYDAKEIEYWFEGEVLERRTMTDSELQVEADFEKNGKKARALKQKLTKPLDPELAGKVGAKVPAAVNGQGEDIGDVIKAETHRRTKTSSVDGPTVQ